MFTKSSKNTYIFFASRDKDDKNFEQSFVCSFTGDQQGDSADSIHKVTQD